jgi:hypothetical protein
VTARARAILPALLLVVVGLGALRDLAALGGALPWHAMDDFPDFYCAGRALDAHASPYTYEPLRACEHEVNAGTTFRGQLFAGQPALAFPAPQPPYDFPPLMALAGLPFDAARAIDALAIVAAVAAAVAALAALGAPVALAAAALVLSAGYASLATGQIVPFALLALVLCGLALAHGRDSFAGVLAALTLIEPTVGVPVAAVTLLFVPRARTALVATIASLALVTIALIGPRDTWLYLTGVLPAHAASEIHFPYQYSLTYALAFLGASDSAARVAGTASYVVMLIVAIVGAPRAARGLQARELIAFVPALCALVGGAFLHQEELCFAIPAATIVALRSAGRARAIAAAALCVLAIPWITVWSSKHLLLAALFACIVILWSLRLNVRAAAPIFVAIGAALYGFELHPPHLPVPVAGSLHRYDPHELVQYAWRDYTQARSTRDPTWFAIKLPEWAALLATLALALRRERPVDGAAGEKGSA